MAVLSSLILILLCSRNCPEDVGGFSVSSGNLMSRNKDGPGGGNKWNPFEDTTPFNQVTEDHIFGAEFDRIRQEGERFREVS